MQKAPLYVTGLALAGLLSAACPAGKSDGKKEVKAASGPSGTAASGPSGATGAPPPPPSIPAPPDVKAAPADAEKTASGLASKVLQKGTGTAHPEKQDIVQVNYAGWTTDGANFDSSQKHGGPATFPLKGVIPGWTEGLQLMVVGEKRRFWIPEELAYKGRPGPQGLLVFDVELLAITPGPKPIPAPPDVSAPPADATKTKSNLAYKVLTPGTGKTKPGPTDKVKVNYTGWTASNGEMFDSSVVRGQPAEFPLDRVIPGWTEALQLMVIGEKARFWVPEELAYKGRNGAPQGMLVFDVELLEVTPGPKPVPVPEDVKAPPKNAKKTATGLAYRVLTKGKGTEHPKPENKVKVHYTGWTTDGKMFDSSVMRGQPTEFPLNQVVAGWTEGLQLMVEGEKTRFWVPEALAYKGAPGAPAGMLVFDVELIEIKPPDPPGQQFNPHAMPHGAGGAGAGAGGAGAGGNPHGATPPPTTPPPGH